MKLLNTHAPVTWLETVWNALHAYRETQIPEGFDPSYDDEWRDLCAAMSGITQALQLPDVIEPGKGGTS